MLMMDGESTSSSTSVVAVAAALACGATNHELRVLAPTADVSSAASDAVVETPRGPLDAGLTGLPVLVRLSSPAELAPWRVLGRQ
jgi:hypothetical protein